MPSPCKRRSAQCAAFSLIEMLVVVTIIVLLLAFTTPALMRTMQSSRLTSAGDTLFGAISEAQQMAYAQNVPVEVRFFKFAEGLDTNTNFRAYQMFKVTLTTEEDGDVVETLVPVNNLTRTPEGIIIVTDQELSPMLSGASLPDSKPGGGAIGYSGVEGAEYNAIRFMTDGSCRKVEETADGLAGLAYQTLPSSFFTITIDNGQEITTANLPKNFYTIQIDPFTGKARNYKPGF
ncbi:Verru_Chthon cassette protein D [Prosthecobacter sp.]|uniref:Verru_Chthon cassette protein D n=1 Tax=Prosthecobacter sp. TaxID=1965333 RepID=UPI002AC9A1F9|nr:Verru_Chthon cassette protein D [Prosthecobacter sp.]